MCRVNRLLMARLSLLQLRHLRQSAFICGWSVSVRVNSCPFAVRSLCSFQEEADGGGSAN
jgi:hypothetical protein